MNERKELLRQFFLELIECYRQKIKSDSDVVRVTGCKREREYRIDELIKSSQPISKEVFEDYAGSVLDLNTLEQEKLYMQGLKDGINLLKILELL